MEQNRDTASIIKDAKREYYKKYREQNKDKLNQYQREYREQNKDKIKEYNYNYWLRKAEQKANI